MATLPYRPLSRDCFEISTLDVALMLGATASPHRDSILLGTSGVPERVRLRNRAVRLCQLGHETLAISARGGSGRAASKEKARV